MQAFKLPVLTHCRPTLERQVSTLRRTRLMCLNMALSRQWRRMTVIYSAWASLARQRILQRKGIIRITSRRFYCIMRLYLGVWCNFGKNSYRSRVLLVFYFPTISKILFPLFAMHTSLSVFDKRAFTGCCLSPAVPPDFAECVEGIEALGLCRASSSRVV